LRRLPAAVWALLALGWAALVWGLLTTDRLPEAQFVTHMLPEAFWPWQDKLGHAALFCVQMLLLERAVRERWATTRRVLGAVALCLLLGAATELRQRSLPHRDADVLDFVADAVGTFGATAALALGESVARRRPATAT
jgi:VanZ family protein